MLLQDAKERAEQTYQHLIDYVEARWNMIALEVSDRTANIATTVVMSLCLAILAIFFLFFISVSLALWVGELLVSYPLGFLIVSALYGIVGGVLYANRKKLLFMPIMNHFLKLLYRNQDDKLV
ncbi:phage holin family protein [Arundinibacter roseus]|uniref:Phage holin family protein n=1 Tax=Arundinibacter roseus TaxID=2070510 RepID=A0A4R4KF38_9BACT|nr:phage holin family protein [Arundinibacter roseus]TDB65191.1 phage holin family protein [Arundinibacter roseus]